MVPGTVGVALVESQVCQQIVIAVRFADGGYAVDDLLRIKSGQILRDDADRPGIALKNANAMAAVRGGRG